MNKNLFIISILFSILLLSGCSKKTYDTVEEYESQMYIIKSKNNSYYLEGWQSLPKGGYHFKVYNKGEKWKAELIMNGKKSIFISDGNKVIAYNPNNSQLSKEVHLKSPVGHLIEWNNNLNHVSKLQEKVFLDQNSKINKFNCRMVQYVENENEYTSYCINDKYGIAVYSKINTMLNDKPIELITKVDKLGIKDISDKIFDF
ncbi:MAG: hypothetical protein MJ237_00955 [bacterium]|nr:hypothetical protein [bacterium]